MVESFELKEFLKFYENILILEISDYLVENDEDSYIEISQHFGSITKFGEQNKLDFYKSYKSVSGNLIKEINRSNISTKELNLISKKLKYILNTIYCEHGNLVLNKNLKLKHNPEFYVWNRDHYIDESRDEVKNLKIKDIENFPAFEQVKKLSDYLYNELIHLIRYIDENKLSKDTKNIPEMYLVNFQDKEEALIDVFRQLKSKGYINNGRFENFVNAFSNRKVSTRLNWNRYKNEFVYFMKNIDLKVDDIWIASSFRFTYKYKEIDSSFADNHKIKISPKNAEFLDRLIRNLR